MRDEFADPITRDQALRRILDTGAVVVRLDPAERLDYLTWRRTLRNASKEHDIRLSFRRVGDQQVIVHNPDHVVTRDQLRRGVIAAGQLADLDETGPASPLPRARDRRLKSVTTPPPENRPN